ncbi:MAG: putative metal-binding motif-containing protein [Deltaproteobacteria bacterium]|nr:putative metal-binding motif-containing protein [Deltaproteobacteria bacterium]
MKSSRLLLSVALGSTLLAGCPSGPEPGPDPVDADGDGFTDDVDCDDANADAYPGAPEVCDGVDTNCDGEDDTVLQITYYLDSDGDGYGDAEQTTRACAPPDGYVVAGTDCDDADAGVSPEAIEVCNEIDDDCDGTNDGPLAADAVPSAVDADGDGYGHPVDAVLTCAVPLLDTSDCDDTNAAINPGATEVCDFVDNDCDTLADLDGWVPTDYATVGDALANAPAGAALCVEDGTWTVSEQTRSSALTLQGVSRTGTLFDAGSSWMLSSTGAVTLRSVTVQNADCNGTQASVIDAGAALVVEDVTVDGASCDGPAMGGVFEVDGVPITLIDVRVDGFTALVDGNHHGVVYSAGGDMTLQGVTIDDADVTATQLYGTIYANGGSVTMNQVHLRDSSFTNTTNLWGLLFTQEVSAAPHAFTDISVTGCTLDVGRTFYGALSLDDLTGDTTVDRFLFADNTIAIGTGPETSAGSKGMLGYSDGGETSFTNLQVTDNVFTNAVTGSVHGLFDASGGLTVLNADIANNDFGVVTTWSGMFENGGGDVELVNATFAENTWTANNSVGDILVIADPLEGMRIAYMNLYESGTGESFYSSEEDGALAATGVTNADPLYTGAATGDYTLSSGSSLIDAGDPDITDADGSRSDLGAFGGPNGALWTP